MEYKKLKPRSLRNVHQEIVTDIRNNPFRGVNSAFYNLMRLNTYKTKPTVKISTPLPLIPNPLTKHIRNQQEFTRSISPIFRKPILDLSGQQSQEKSLLDIINTANTKKISEIQKKHPNLDDWDFENFGLFFDKSNQAKSEYRMRYDKIFKGKYSKNSLKFID